VYTKVWWGKLKGMRSLGKPTSKWKDNINVDLKEFVNRGLHLIDLFQDKDNWWGLVNVIVNFRVLQNPGDVIAI
jgi:hypothetical protein